MALMIPHKAARLLYDLALANKKDPSDLLAELIERAAEEQKRGAKQATERIAKCYHTQTQTEVRQ
jgi:hypothetical protein